MNVLRELWKNKPLAIAVAAGLVIVIYLVYKNGAGSAIAPASTSTNAGTTTTPGGGYSGGTLVEESYYNNSPSSTTITNPVSTTPVLPQILSPAAKGSLKSGSKSAGKGDTNFWIYTVPAGATLTSIAQFARWGNDYAKLANYRNNMQILQAAGVNTANPYAQVPAGLKLSV